ncbi:MAG: alkylhydroperoxidase [Actinobacteria bacterium]|nr:MAG: alkylhydroperoxidase [Actinomycetota bacterium]REK39952.1 MAG: alkylhydroperoxidase [Actinomycetota bacterium]
MSRYPLTSLEDLPDDLRERIEPIAERTGFVPNVFLGMGHRPDELRAFMDYHDALMERESGLSKAEREMIVVATSAANDCLYCVIAHGAILRIRAKDSEIADRIATNWRTAPITDRQRAMLDFAVMLARFPEEIDETDFDILHEHGFSDDDIWDIGSITALFALSNRIAHLAALDPNTEFYEMGR